MSFTDHVVYMCLATTVKNCYQNVSCPLEAFMEGGGHIKTFLSFLAGGENLKYAVAS